MVEKRADEREAAQRSSTVTMELLALAERVEKLAGPCRETDCLIFEAGHRLLTPERRGTIDGEPTGEYYGVNGDQLPERAPAYTASLDAAMTLARTPQEAYQATQDALSTIARRDGLHCNFYRGSFADDLARTVVGELLRALASQPSPMSAGERQP